MSIVSFFVSRKDLHHHLSFPSSDSFDEYPPDNDAHEHDNHHNNHLAPFTSIASAILNLPSFLTDPPSTSSSSSFLCLLFFFFLFSFLPLSSFFFLLHVPLSVDPPLTNIYVTLFATNYQQESKMMYSTFK